MKSWSMKIKFSQFKDKVKFIENFSGNIFLQLMFVFVVQELLILQAVKVFVGSSDWTCIKKGR